MARTASGARRAAGATSTVYLGDVYENTGGSATKYYNFGARRVAVNQGGTLHYLLPDALGSTTTVLNSSGTIVERSQKYYPYGRARSQVTVGKYTDKQFTGHQQELGEMYYMQSRFYNAWAGRMLQPDSIVPDPMNPQALNRYSYVMGNPLRYTDPTGQWPWDDAIECASNGFDCVRDPVANWVSTGANGLGHTLAWAWTQGSAVYQSVWSQTQAAAMWVASTTMSAAADAADPVAYPILEAVSEVAYAPYYLSYYALRGIDSLPPYVRAPLYTNPATIQFHLDLLTLEAVGFAADMAVDVAKQHILGSTDNIRDDGVSGPVLGSRADKWLRDHGMKRWSPQIYLPGRGDRDTDWSWGIGCGTHKFGGC